nr:hypothetical protein [Tanacetum cinerariifolium]
TESDLGEAPLETEESQPLGSRVPLMGEEFEVFEPSEEEGPGTDEEEKDATEVQQQAVLVMDTATSEPLGRGYEALRRRELAVEVDQAPSTFETPPSPEWSSGSLLVSASSLVVPSPVASPVATR